MPSLFRRINTLADHIWPATQATATRWQLFAMTLAAGLALGWLMRSAPLLGHDWLIMFHANTATDVYYPPWTSLLLTPLANLPWRDGLALINGISIATVATSTYHQGKQTNNPWRLGATLLAVFSLQLAIVLWLGHIDGLALLGLLALPWAAPLVLMKATFIGFAVFARKSWFLAAVLFGLASLLLWPGWPNQLLQTLSLRNTHPSAAGWEVTGWLPPVIGLVMLLLRPWKKWVWQAHRSIPGDGGRLVAVPVRSAVSLACAASCDRITARPVSADGLAGRHTDDRARGHKSPLLDLLHLPSFHLAHPVPPRRQHTKLAGPDHYSL